MDPIYAGNVSLIAAEAMEYGRVLVAGKDFMPGDIVFAEAPIMLWTSSSSSSSSSSSYSSLAQIDDVDESVRFDYNYIAAFTELSKALQDEVLDLHYPDFTKSDIDSYLMEYSSRYFYRKMVVDMFAKMGYFNGLLDEESMLRLLLICDSNAHTFYGCDGSDSDNKQRSALFKYGSKMEHSCRPNATYSSKNKDNRLVYTASQFIAAGSRLSFTYIESYKLSREQRIELLRSSFYFVCKCVRCHDAEFDDSRAMRCTACSHGVCYFLNKRNSNGDSGGVSTSSSSACATIEDPAYEGDASETPPLVCLVCKAINTKKKSRDDSRSEEANIEKKYNTSERLWKECQSTDIFRVRPSELENLLVRAMRSLHFTHYLVGNISALCAAVYAAHYEQLSRTIDDSTPEYAVSTAIGYKFLGVDILRERSLHHSLLQLKSIECLIAGCTVSHAGICEDQLLFPHIPSTEAAHLSLFCFQDARLLDLSAGTAGTAGPLSSFLARRYYSSVCSHYGREDVDVVAMESLCKL